MQEPANRIESQFSDPRFRLGKNSRPSAVSNPQLLSASNKFSSVKRTLSDSSHVCGPASDQQGSFGAFELLIRN